MYGEETKPLSDCRGEHCSPDRRTATGEEQRFVDNFNEIHKVQAEGTREMKVLVACEESQRVCMAFRAKGHEAYSADIQDCSGGHPEWHIKGDVLEILNGNCFFLTCDHEVHEISGNWDLIIAHPPCTYLSNAGACRLYPKKGLIDAVRLEKGLDAKEFFLKFLNAVCEKICIENPVPSRIYRLPKPTQSIQPYEYGHPYTKKTYLWLRGLPKLKPTNVVKPKGGGYAAMLKYGKSKLQTVKLSAKRKVQNTGQKHSRA